MNKEANVSNLKVRDKVVYNIEGSSMLKLNRPDLIGTFERITYGVVTEFSVYSNIAVIRWIDYKGIVVFRSWIVYTKYLELYKP